MPKPVIWTVDDDPDVLRGVERDLRRQYGDRYRVLAAESGGSALATVEQLKLRNERAIANRHGGEIEFESKPSETRFKVRLPIAHAPAAPNGA